MNLTQYVVLTCQDTAYVIKEISYSNGDLTLTVDYTTDMESHSCLLSLSFDSSIIRSPNTSLSFSAKSQTLKLVIVTRPQEY
jgi:hypothetical protein